MKIVYFGTPEFAAEILSYLLDHGVEVVGIVTQPDRPKGRSLQLTPSAVKAVALERLPGIPLFQPLKASEETFLAQLAALQADLFVVVAFGQILPQRLLDLAPAINVHPSLLPKFRGAAPIHRTLMAGETETGVTIQKIIKQLDAGDILAATKTPVPSDMTFGELDRILTDEAKRLLLHVIRQFAHGIPPSTPQDHSQATYAHKFEPEDLEVRWDKPAQELHNLVRAFSPKPGAWCTVFLNNEPKRLKILRTRPTAATGTPGQLLPHATVACQAGALQLLLVQPEGKKAMSAEDWLRGQKNISFLKED